MCYVIMSYLTFVGMMYQFGLHDTEVNLVRSSRYYALAHSSSSDQKVLRSREASKYFYSMKYAGAALEFVSNHKDSFGMATLNKLVGSVVRYWF